MESVSINNPWMHEYFSFANSLEFGCMDKGNDKGKLFSGQGWWDNLNCELWSAEFKSNKMP